MARFLSKFTFPRKPLATWLPLSFFVQPLASLSKRGQRWKIDENCLASHCRKHCSTFGFPLVSHCRKPMRSQDWWKLFQSLIKFSFPSENSDSIVFYCSTFGFTWLPIVGSQREAKYLNLIKIISKLNISTMSIRHFLSKFTFPSKTPGYLASIVFYCSTFGFTLVSHCRKPMRTQGSKIEENYFKVEYFYHWACATFCQNLLSPENPWLLGFHCFPLFNLWLPLGFPL